VPLATALIDILVPTYEPNPAYLREAIRSVLRQTEQRWTLLIQDDASQIDVRAIVRSQFHDPRMTFVRNPTHLGIGGSWNACLRHGSAPHIQYLFQDDVWQPHYLERALAILTADPAIGFVAVDHDYAFEGEIPTRALYERLREEKRLLLSGGRHDGQSFLHSWMERGLHPNLIGEPSFVMMRRSSLEIAGGFAQDMLQFLDVEMWTRLLQHTNFSYLAEELGTFRVHLKGASLKNYELGCGLLDRLRCIERVLQHIPYGGERRRIEDRLVTHLSGMVQKFFKRVQRQERTQLDRVSAIPHFAFRHPLLTLKAVTRALR